MGFSAFFDFLRYTLFPPLPPTMPAPKCTIQGVIIPSSDGYSTFGVQQWLNDFLIPGEPGDKYKKRLEELESCKISGFEHRKRTGGLEHEYLAFTLHDQYGDNRLLRVERSFFPPEGLEDLDTFPKKVWIVKSIKGVGKPATANDSVFISTSSIHAETHGTKEWILSSFTFPRNRQPTVLDVAIVSFCVSKISEPYLGKTYMCYWYSDAISRVLSSLFPGKSVVSRDGWRAGHFRTFRMLTEDGRFIHEGVAKVVNDTLGSLYYEKLRGWLPEPKAARESHSGSSPSPGADSSADSSAEAHSSSSSSEGDTSPQSEADTIIFAEPGRVVVEESPSPAVDLPEADRPEADRPEADHPEADRPEADHPEADHPEADHPEADHPEADHPEADRPEADRPEAAWPENVKKMVANVAAKKEEVVSDIRARDAARITKIERLEDENARANARANAADAETARAKAETAAEATRANAEAIRANAEATRADAAAAEAARANAEIARMRAELEQLRLTERR